MTLQQLAAGSTATATWPRAHLCARREAPRHVRRVERRGVRRRRWTAAAARTQHPSLQPGRSSTALLMSLLLAVYGALSAGATAQRKAPTAQQTVKISIPQISLMATVDATSGALVEQIAGGSNEYQLLTFRGPRVLGVSLQPLAARWGTLVRGGTQAAPTLTATGSLLIPGRPATPGGIFTVSKDTDYVGGDYKHFALRNASSPASDCQAACESELHSSPACIAWVWTCPGMQGPRPNCWLKDRVLSGPPRTDCATSGVYVPPQPAVPDTHVELTRTVRLEARGPTSGAVHISHSLRCASAGTPCSLSSFEDTFQAILGKSGSGGWYGELPDAVWSQSIKGAALDVVPHWNFKSPALMVQEGALLAALVADLGPPGGVKKGELPTHPRLLDLTNPHNASIASPPTMVYGLGQTAYRVHSIYARTPREAIDIAPNTTVDLRYILLLNTAAPDAKAGGDFASVASLLWEVMGSAALHATPHQQRGCAVCQNTQLDLFSSWQKHSWGVTAQSLYYEFPCEGGRALGLNCSSIATERVRFSNHVQTSNRDMWMNAWFQTLRQSLGLFQYGMQTQDARMQQQALGTVILALEAPQDGGAFPSIFWLGQDNTTTHWVADSGWAGLCREEVACKTCVKPEGSGAAPANCTGFYHLFDNVWTSYWLLQWRRQPGVPATVVSRIDRFTRRVAVFVASKQETVHEAMPPAPVNGPNGGGDYYGGVPSWFAPGSLEPRPEMRFNAETAAAALFLSEAHAAGLSPPGAPTKYLRAAELALDFVEREIVTSGRWFDFETFVSCSKKSFDFFDTRTNQHPANNLAMIQAAMAELRLFELTGNASRLAWGEKILGRLSLTQAVWSHPELTPVLSGGFTTQNTDTEWSDNRQHLCAVVYLQYYLAVTPRRPEYLERAVAALRSTFAVAPYENWAHTGGSQGDVQGAESSAAHWGECSASTSVGFTRSQLGDLFVYVGDIPHPHGVCVNGCTLTGLRVSNEQPNSVAVVSLNVTSPFDWSKSPEGFVTIVDGATGPMEVVLNERACGTFTAARLKAGVQLPVPTLDARRA